MEKEGENLNLTPYSIVSYDLSGLKQSIKTKISQRVYGKKSKKTVKDKVYDYTYKGLKDESNVRLISESTLLLPEEKANGFVEFLERNNVRYKLIKIWKS